MELINDSDLIGTCDTCNANYDVSSRGGRCGDCGECMEHCTHDIEYIYPTKQNGLIWND